MAWLVQREDTAAPQHQGTAADAAAQRAAAARERGIRDTQRHRQPAAVALAIGGEVVFTQPFIFSIENYDGNIQGGA